MEKQHNVLRKWWFNFVFVPLVFLAFALPTFLGMVDEQFKNDSFLYVWLIIFVVAMVIELIFVWAKDVKHKGEHFMFIAASILFSILVGFIIHKILGWSFDASQHLWIEGTYLIVSPILLIIFKTILWALLHKKAKNSKRKEKKIVELKNKVEKLEEEKNTD